MFQCYLKTALHLSDVEANCELYRFNLLLLNITKLTKSFLKSEEESGKSLLYTFLILSIFNPADILWKKYECLTRYV